LPQVETSKKKKKEKVLECREELVAKRGKVKPGEWPRDRNNPSGGGELGFLDRSMKNKAKKGEKLQSVVMGKPRP